MAEQKDKIAIQFRCDPAYNERLQAHADTPIYEGSKSHFVRRATTTIMDLQDALGTQFDHVISELIDGVEAEKAIAA